MRELEHLPPTRTSAAGLQVEAGEVVEASLSFLRVGKKIQSRRNWGQQALGTSLGLGWWIRLALWTGAGASCAFSHLRSCLHSMHCMLIFVEGCEAVKPTLLHELEVAGNPERSGYFPENRANWLSQTLRESGYGNWLPALIPLRCICRQPGGSSKETARMSLIWLLFQIPGRLNKFGCVKDPE